MFGQILNHKIFLILIITLEQAIVDSVERTPSHENKDVYKIKLDPTRHQLSDFFRLGQLPVLRILSSVKDRPLNTSVTKLPYKKKWQVGRVSRKQYEIINMLWRKTKEFGDVDMSTVNYYPTKSLLRVSPRLQPTSTTSSFIEFYYLDEDNNKKHQLFIDERSRHHALEKMKRATADYPNFAFRINDPKYALLALPTKQVATNKVANDILTQKAKISSSSINGLPHYEPFKNLNIFLTKTTLAQKIKNTILNYFKSNHVSVIENFVDNETCPVTETFMTSDYGLQNRESNINPRTSSKYPKLTTIYDRIKFFEIYDKNTPLPYHEGEEKLTDLDDIERIIHGNKLSNDLKVVSEHVNQKNINEYNATQKARHAKKHIIENNIKNSLTTENYPWNSIFLFNLTTKHKNATSRLLSALPSASNLTKFHVNTISAVATWSEFSYMAAYIYEPARVHCDAAAISSHWLVTSGSCLLRRHNNPQSEGRSAFVAYCGNSWWNPDRVAYVKYSVVHPRYNQREKQRRYMFNIGLIQVEVSMATCPGWAPVSIMSHQFAGYSEGYKAYAVGWGLDRYDTRYAATDLPKYPLMVYESMVFSNSCPGKFNHSQTKHMDSENGIKDLYCLLLPPYLGENTDPIHGSMLLIEGKLCAIYLQEERRPTGSQSAHYTGIWRLGPWVSDMAREPEDVETFRFHK